MPRPGSHPRKPLLGLRRKPGRFCPPCSGCHSRPTAMTPGGCSAIRSWSSSTPDARPASRTSAVRADELAVDARALVPGLADRAGVVGGEERADHELAGLDVLDLAPDLLNDADVLVAHRGRPVDRFDPAIGHRSEPQTQVADRWMIASVGARILGSSRSCTRTSPGAYITAPRMTFSFALTKSGRGAAGVVDRPPVCWTTPCQELRPSAPREASSPAPPGEAHRPGSAAIPWWTCMPPSGLRAGGSPTRCAAGS